MKKFFKALLASAVALITAFAVFAFTGCDMSGKNPDNNPDKGQNGTTQTTVTDNIVGADYSALDINAALVTSEGTMTVGAKVNLSGKADVEFSSVGTGVNAGDNFYGYFFMRDWKVYGVFDDDKITDFANAELAGFVDIKQAIGAIKESIPSDFVIPAEVLDMFDVSKINELVGKTLGEINGALLKLAKAGDALTETDLIVTVDLNKLAYNMLNEVKGVLNSINGNTTVDGLLKNQTVKKYAQAFTENIKPEQLVKSVLDNLETVKTNIPAEGQEQVKEIIKKISELFVKVAPDKDSTTYDYMLKLINSQELADLINGLMPDGFGLTCKVGELTLNSLYEIISGIVFNDEEDGEMPATFDEMLMFVKQTVEQYTSKTTRTKLEIALEEGAFSLSNARIVYTLSGKDLVSQQIIFSCTANGMIIGGDVNIGFKKTNFADSDFEKLPSTLPEIEDFEIGNNEPPYEDYE